LKLAVPEMLALNPEEFIDEPEPHFEPITIRLWDDVPFWGILGVMIATSIERVVDTLFGKEMDLSYIVKYRGIMR
jgi:hypothetical protein